MTTIRSILRKNILIISIILSVVMIGTALFLNQPKKVLAGTGISFGGLLDEVNVCCDGLELIVLGESGGDFVIPWERLIPAPIGGNYSDYNVEEPNDQYVLGLAEPGGICADPESECVDSRPVEATVINVGSSSE